MINDFVSASSFFASLASDERVFLLVRHGERNHITPDDPDFGAHVGLTDRGREQALTLGRCIPAEGDVCFFATASAQNAGMTCFPSYLPPSR